MGPSYFDGFLNVCLSRLSQIATIVYSRHSRVKFNPLWLNNLYERTVADFQVEEINPLVVNPGRLLVTNAFIYFQYYNNISTVGGKRGK